MFCVTIFYIIVDKGKRTGTYQQGLIKPKKDSNLTCSQRLAENNVCRSSHAATMPGGIGTGFFVLKDLSNQKDSNPKHSALSFQFHCFSHLVLTHKCLRHFAGVLRLEGLIKPKSTDAFASVLFGLVGQQGLEPRTNRL